MFLINGDPLNATTHPKEFAWLESKLQEIRDREKDSYIFTPFDKRNMVMREDGRMIPQKTRKRIVSMIGTTSEATGLYQTWSYVPGMSALKADGSGGYTITRKTMALDYDTVFSVDKDIELIFFFESLTQNRNVKKVDYQLISMDEAKARAVSSKAENLIFDPDSPIHPDKIKSELPLRNIGLAWGVTNALSTDIYTLMRDIWTRVQQGQQNYRKTKRGFKEFIEEVNNYGDTTRRAIVIQAIERGILVYQANIWKMISEGGVESFLCGVPFQDEKHKENYIVDYVLNHETIYETIKVLLKDTPKAVEQKKEEARVKAELGVSRGELLKLAKENNYYGSDYQTVSKMKNDTLREFIKQHNEPEEGSEG